MGEQRLEAHEIATIFPSMSQVDMDHLQESIAKQGQLEDILLFQGKVLDGRHRYEACLALGVTPRFRAFEGTEQEAFVHSVALNLSRRHMTTVQRAAAGAGIKELQARLMASAAPAAEPAPIDVSIDEPAAPAPRAATAAEAAPTDEVAPAPEAAAREPAPRAPGARTINARARAMASQRTGVSGRAIDTAEKIKQDAPDVFERMLAGTAGSLPDAKRVTALPLDVRDKVHALVDEGKNLKAALREVSPPPAPEEGALFIGKLVLEPEQARAFEALLEVRGLKRADAAREAVLDWIQKYTPSLSEQPGELVA